jgi:hypothetical protein
MTKDPGPVRRGNTRTFLASVLQRMQTQIGQISGFRMPENSKNAALFTKFV